LGKTLGGREDRFLVYSRITENQCATIAVVGVKARQGRRNYATAGRAFGRLIVPQAPAELGRKATQQMHPGRMRAHCQNFGQVLLGRFDQGGLSIAVNGAHPANVRGEEAFAYKRIDDGLCKYRWL